MNKEKLHNIVFESNTRAGRMFDLSVLIAILFSTLLVMLDSVPSYHNRFGGLFLNLEWIITIFFTLEYLLRIYVVKNKGAYLFSFFGIVDLLSILPSYLGLFIAGGQFLSIIRVLRLMRIFRILNLSEYTQSGLLIMGALRESRKKIIVFLIFILLMVSAFGGVMYVVESGHPESGFESIPISIYWAIVTITTVGYGDISPVTPVGRFLASVVMILGYAVIAVPTGIVTAEMGKFRQSKMDFTQHCDACGATDHPKDSKFCWNCGESLHKEKDKIK